MNANFDITQGINFNLIVFFSTFIFSIIGTKLVILSLKNRITSPDIAVITGKRKASIPNNGGIAMIFAIVCGFLATEVNFIIIAVILLLAGLPILGNLMPIAKSIRLAVRIIAVAVTINIIPTPIFSQFFPPIFDKTLACCLWLWIIHSFDKLDAVEGLVPVQMTSIGLGIAALMLLNDAFFSPSSIQAVIFACAGIGFWWWNRHPAKILGGEIGRVPAGFIAGYLLLLIASEGYVSAAIILPAYFLMDSLLVFFDRPFSEKFTSEKKNQPKKPYTLRAIKNSYSPRWIIRTIAGTNMLLLYLAAQNIISPWMTLFNSFLAYIMVFTLIWYLTQKNTSHYDI